jgi:hypothetical protein
VARLGAALPDFAARAQRVALIESLCGILIAKRKTRGQSARLSATKSVTTARWTA